MRNKEIQANNESFSYHVPNKIVLGIVKVSFYLVAFFFFSNVLNGISELVF